MGIELIANPKKEIPPKIWANKEMDEARREECLCYNCDRKKDNPPYSSCPTSSKLFKVAVEENMAMMITRCGAVDDKGELLYKPLNKNCCGQK